MESKPAHDLYGRFTSQRDGRFVVVINEASGIDNFTADSQIKDMITGTGYNSESKGTDAFKMKCFSRFVFTTNNDNCLKLCADDRRFVVIEVSADKKGDQQYFDTLSAHMADQHTQHEFYQLLMARDLSCRRWEKDRPITKSFMQMVHASMPYEHMFLKDMVLRLRLERVASHRVASDMLCCEFQAWLTTNGPVGKPYDTNARKFGVKLSKLTSDSFVMGGFLGLVRGRVSSGVTYTLDTASMMEAMLAKKWMTADEAAETTIDGPAFGFKDDGDE